VGRIKGILRQAHGRIRRLARIWGALAVALAALAAPAEAAPFVVDPDRPSQRVGVGIAAAPESTPGRRPDERAFKPVASGSPPHFPAGDGARWLRLVLANESAEPVERVLVVRFPYLDAVDLHAQLADGTSLTAAAGAMRPVGETFAPFPAFPLTLPPGESVLHLRVESAAVVIAPLELHAPDAFQRLVLRDHLVIGGVLGAGLVLALYLSLLAGGPRDDRHAAFLALTLAALGHVLVTTGIGKVWFWPSAEMPSMNLVFLAQGLVLGTGAWFFRTVLRGGGLPSAVDRALRIFSLAGFAIVLAPALPGPLVQALHLIAAAIAPPTLFLFAVFLWARGRPEAGVLALGWGPAQAVTLHWYLRAFDLTAYHPVNHYLGLLAFAGLIAVYARDLSREAQRAAIAAEHDPLTGLGNRTRMERAFYHLAATRGAERVAVIQVDLDRFKALNDTLGHAAGDEALVEISARFRGALRADDVLCRIGGDEFVAIIPYSGDRADLATIAQRLLSTVRPPVRTRWGDWTLGASIGIAIGDPAGNLPALQADADAALYRVKQAGRNGFRFAEQGAAVDFALPADRRAPRAV
jgi:diguanylate cyclase (GGDEF)-like protein